VLVLALLRLVSAPPSCAAAVPVAPSLLFPVAVAKSILPRCPLWTQLRSVLWLPVLAFLVQNANGFAQAEFSEQVRGKVRFHPPKN
jgi:hypothetical protein